MDQDAFFDEIIDRRGTHCSKWDKLAPLYGIDPGEGIAMWVADMDFRPPEAVLATVRRIADHGLFGYFADDGPYLDAIRWWMRERHGWEVAREEIFTTAGLVNGTALVLDTFSAPGDGVAVMSPVYHAFFRTIRAAGREVTELPLAVRDGRHAMDFAGWDGMLTGRERILILCSPHNPGGRVWTRAELEGVADFARRHDLLLLSDEIHHDLVMPGHRHLPMAKVDGVADRLVMMTAASKTFSIAGAAIGNVIIPDPRLRARFAARMAALSLHVSSFGMHMVPAAYSPEGAAWVDRLVRYLDGNRRLFEAGMAGIPGVRPMPLEATYLTWVDFSGTGMSPAEVRERVEGKAKVAPNRGETFGRGGESFLRFNVATPRARVAEAVERLQAAFADLQ